MNNQNLALWPRLLAPPRSPMGQNSGWTTQFGSPITTHNTQEKPGSKPMSSGWPAPKKLGVWVGPQSVPMSIPCFLYNRMTYIHERLIRIYLKQPLVKQIATAPHDDQTMYSWEPEAGMGLINELPEKPIQELQIENISLILNELRLIAKFLVWGEPLMGPLRMHGHLEVTAHK